MKRSLAPLLALLLACALAACGGAKEETEPPAEETPLSIPALRLELTVPEGATGQALLSAADGLPARLTDALAAERAEVGSVTLTYSRSSLAAAEALAGGGTDAAILSGEAAAEQGGLTAVLAVGGAGLAAGGASAADWNDPAAATTDAAPLYGLLIAADTVYGRQLADRMNRAGTLTAAEWSNARLGVTEDALLRKSASLFFSDTCGGMTTASLTRVTVYDTAEALAAAAEAGEVDAALLRSAVRAADPARFAALPVLAVTGPLYETVLAVRSGDAVFSAPRFLAALQSAFPAAEAEGDGALSALCGGSFVPVDGAEFAAFSRLAAWEEVS